MTTHYKTLEIEETASSIEIKQSYKRLAKIHHPDRGGDEEVFKQINEAYSILSDDKKRSLYDLSRSPRQRNNDFESNFSNFQNGFKYGVAVFVTLREIYLGLDKQISFNNNIYTIKIPKGITNNSTIIIPNGGPNGFDLEVRIRVLPDENIKLNLLDIETDLEIDFIDAILGCEREIKLWEDVVIGNLKIPQGVNDSQKIRLRGKGMSSRYNTVGDIYIKIKIKIPKFEELPEELKECILKINRNKEVLNGN